MLLPTKFHRPMFNRSEVILLPTNQQTSNEILLKTSTSPVENYKDS